MWELKTFLQLYFEFYMSHNIFLIVTLFNNNSFRSSTTFALSEMNFLLKLSNADLLPATSKIQILVLLASSQLPRRSISQQNCNIGPRKRNLNTHGASHRTWTLKSK